MTPYYYYNEIIGVAKKLEETLKTDVVVVYFKLALLTVCSAQKVLGSNPSLILGILWDFSVFASLSNFTYKLKGVVIPISTVLRAATRNCEVGVA